MEALDGEEGTASLRREYIRAIAESGTENMSRDDLVALLDDIRQRVSTGDSMEGFLSYMIAGYEEFMEWDENGRVGPEPRPPHPYNVEARYRLGNRMGQGGMRMIGVKALQS